ncbi:MAG: hypothetical protein ACLFMR_06425, partial [Desulfohalobiaceae bacterium]
MGSGLSGSIPFLYGKLDLQQQLSPKRASAARPSACGKVEGISIDSDYHNDHDCDLLCPPLAVVVVIVIVIDILTIPQGRAALAL